ncbi:DsrE family protein [Thiomicrorhabdus sp. ZW0627]|uniref:DsrE family protein n=1 Tax=Thiomicrorhabdus sp. ZW0627 TaxID=3039774 RepID=UPI002436D1E9|nr:DsrE family protein [Thiomicrorhabdus sp. ZW0627]MDG6773525.1 DsrE family protein [Thiomicrorhabdus sp. ZW0627]
MRLLIHTLIVSLALFVGLNQTAQAADATSGKDFKLKPVPELQNPPSDRFPGDPAEHKAVYMWNKADAEYQHAILNSIQAMIKYYGDNVDIAVVAIGPGLHALAKEPKREVDPLTYERVASFAKDYNVRWIACGNTMNTVHWSQSDMRPFAEYAEVGAAALMELQEEGYKLLVW